MNEVCDAASAADVFVGDAAVGGLVDVEAGGVGGRICPGHLHFVGGKDGGGWIGWRRRPGPRIRRGESGGAWRLAGHVLDRLHLIEVVEAFGDGGVLVGIGARRHRGQQGEIVAVAGGRAVDRDGITRIVGAGAVGPRQIDFRGGNALPP